MHRIPKTGIKKILGIDVNIVLVDGLIDEDDTLGVCDSDCDTIYISTKQTKRSMQDTMVHETLHYISDKLNLKLNHNQIHGITTGYMSVKNKRG